MSGKVCLFWAVLCISFGYMATAEQAKPSSKRIITIESAKSTEYIKRPQPTAAAEESTDSTTEPETGIEPGTPDEDSGEPDVTSGVLSDEVIRLRGNVSIVVTEGSSISTIKADDVIYDKQRETLDARGNVVYEHTTGERGFQRFEGEALLFDIKNQEGVFLDGVLTRDSGKKEGDPFIIHSDLTGRDTSGTIAFKKGVLTTCDDPDPHWSIRASRIWMLPGNEIALLNALFFVGPLPVFYIPFFYYPGDEMIFHPVFGYRNREGFFVQTTTYLYGRKPLPEKEKADETTFADFLQGDILKEQRREGLFLRNLDEDAKNVGEDYFKIMVDAYSSLGFLLGFDGSFTGSGYVKSFSLLGSIGFSNTLYEPSSGISYSTYDSAGEEHDNSGYFFGKKVPFRYRTEMALAMDKAPFQIKLSFPLVSDPFYKDDFYDRSEDLNWYKLLFDQEDTETDSDDIIDETSYSMTLNGSIRPALVHTKPWLDTFAVNTISGMFTFNSKTNTTLNAEDSVFSPERKFYYPEIIRPQISISLGGTLYSTADVTPGSAVSQKVETGKIRSPFTDTDSGVDKDKEEPGNDAVDKDTRVTGIDRFIPEPEGAVAPFQAMTGHVFLVTWGVDPSFVHETRYNAGEWDSSADIDWGEYASLYNQLKANASLTGSYSYDTNFLKISSAISFSGTYQDHPFLSDTVYDTEQKRNAVKNTDYTASVYSVKTVDSLVLKPFHRDPFLHPFSFSWNFTGDLLQQNFTGTAEDPEWDLEPLQWERKYIDVHEAGSVLGVALGPHEQRFTLKSNLPPLLDSYSGNMYLSWLYGNMNLSTRYYELESGSYTDHIWEPFRAKLSWNIPPGITLGQEYIYNIEEEEHTQLHFTAGYKYLSAYYTMLRTIPYRMEAGTGWVQETGGEEFIPAAMGLSFNNASSPLELKRWKNRIALQTRVISNLKFDLVKLTESSFTFSLELTLKIHDFLDISFSSTSSNEVIARYFQDYIDLPAPLPGESNVFVDLWKSFNFLNTEDRKESGFKLQSLNFQLTHYLHDWTMHFRTSLKPELRSDGGSYRYEFTPLISFIVQWKPVTDLKTTVRSEEGVFSLNDPKNDEEMASFIPK